MNKLALAPGTRGFDADGVIRPSIAKALWNQGYRFGARYIPRVHQADYDLGPMELDLLLSQGFGVMPVQHVEPGFWTPTLDKGKLYGENAVKAVETLQMPKGISVGCDLESVSAEVPTETTIGYCNAWYDQVFSAGYQPCLYVGFQPGINAHDLYYRLKFSRYWQAWNLNRDQFPVKRGFCLVQHSTHSTLGFDFDENVAQLDSLGGYLTVTVR